MQSDSSRDFGGQGFSKVGDVRLVMVLGYCHCSKDKAGRGLYGKRKLVKVGGLSQV